MPPNTVMPMAKSAALKALDLDPNLAEAAVSLGLVLGQTGRPEQAIEQYRNALRVRPQMTAAHFNLGVALLQLGSYMEAKQDFGAVIRADANDYQAHLYLGKLLLREGNNASAIAHLKKASASPRQEVKAAALDALRTIRR